MLDNLPNSSDIEVTTTSVLFNNPRVVRIFEMVTQGKTLEEIKADLNITSDVKLLNTICHPQFLRRLQNYLIYSDIRQTVLRVEETETMRQAVEQRRHADVNKDAEPKQLLFPKISATELMKEYHKLLMNKETKHTLSPELLQMIYKFMSNNKKPKEKVQDDQQVTDETKAAFGYEETQFTEVKPKELDEPTNDSGMDTPEAPENQQESTSGIPEP